MPDVTPSGASRVHNVSNACNASVQCIHCLEQIPCICLRHSMLSVHPRICVPNLSNVFDICNVLSAFHSCHASDASTIRNAPNASSASNSSNAGIASSQMCLLCPVHPIRLGPMHQHPASNSPSSALWERNWARMRIALAFKRLTSFTQTHLGLGISGYIAA